MSDSRQSPSPPPTSSPAEATPPGEAGRDASGWERRLEEKIARHDLRDQTRASAPSWHMMLGLIVVWGSLYMVALAQHMSRNEIHIGAIDSVDPAHQGSLLATLDARKKARLMVDSVHFHQAPRRQIVRLLLRQAQIGISEEALAEIPADPINVSEAMIPMGVLMHRVIGDPKLGFAIMGNRAYFFEQRLSNTEPTVGPLRRFEWEADVLLGSEPTVLIPAARTDFWFAFELRPRLSADPEDNHARIGVEIWRADRLVAAGEEDPDPDGKATLRFTAGGTGLIALEKIEAETSKPEPGVEGSPYRIRIFFEQHGLAPAAAEPTVPHAPSHSEKS